ncbi:hypothetical protein SFA35_04030 [Pseudomonas sp. HR96]|uniref:hypothetical protein n=1 Tax=Pseudomonas sp. HR96 TaxID=1027966 RepID=UPI002A7545EB|nr:hypothetical protein [Pseudomonas sp. HR96]WPP00559.1 hypothetical protein SFA35_04030 [Pseudomonas sp. HR96]
MLSGIFEWAELAKQFTLTGVMVLFSAGLILGANRFLSYSDGWLIHAGVAVCALLEMIFPYGWNSMFGDGQGDIDWDALRSGLPYISPVIRFEADIIGGLIGLAIAYAVYYVLSNRERW